jgi:hypothetical protein
MSVVSQVIRRRDDKGRKAAFEMAGAWREDFVPGVFFL